VLFRSLLPSEPALPDPSDASRTRLAESGGRICELAHVASETEDPETALRILGDLRRELDAFEREHVGRGLAAGRSFGALARVLGISRQAAHRRYRDLAPRPTEPRDPEPRRLEASAQVRRVAQLARAEACAAGRTAVGSRELLLALLRTDVDATRVLQASGVTLEAARACDAADDELADPSAARRILRHAGGLALAHGDGRLGCRQLLVALLADRDRRAARTLVALGVAPSSLLARLGC